MSVDCACPACAKPARVWGEKNGHALFRCVSCGVVFIDPRTPDEAPGLYDAEYSRPHPRSAYMEQALNRLVDAIGLSGRDVRLLDIGFGAGDLLDVAKSRGFTTYGVEVSRVAIESAERRGHHVSPSAEAFDRRDFDGVTLIETLEHVVDGTGVLKFAASMLRPGGVLYLTTPNADSLNRRLLGVRWTAVAPVDHRTLWTKRSLAQALHSAGFTATLRTEGFSPIDLMNATKALVARRNAPAVHHANASAAIASAMGASSSRRLVKDAVNALLRATNLGDTLKARAVLKR